MLKQNNDLQQNVIPISQSLSQNFKARQTRILSAVNFLNNFLNLGPIDLIL